MISQGTQFHPKLPCFVNPPQRFARLDIQHSDITNSSGGVGRSSQQPSWTCGLSEFGRKALSALDETTYIRDCCPRMYRIVPPGHEAKIRLPSLFPNVNKIVAMVEC